MSSLLEQFVAEYNVKALRQIAEVARQHHKYLAHTNIPIDQSNLFFRVGHDLERLAAMAEKAQLSMEQDTKGKTNGQ